MLSDLIIIMLKDQNLILMEKSFYAKKNFIKRNGPVPSPL